MANTKSAKKAMRVATRRARENRPVRTATRTRVRRAEAAIAASASSETTDTAIVRAISALDKAASKHVIHANGAARRKSRLMKRLNQARRAAQA